MPRSPTTADVFNALGEVKRREIVDLLAEVGEQPVNVIVARLGMAQPQVSKHLRVLREVDVVRMRQAGRERLYRLNADRLREISDWIRTFDRFWGNQLARIKTRAEATERAAQDQKQDHDPNQDENETWDGNPGPPSNPNQSQKT